MAATKDNKKNWLEWTVTIISAFLVLSTLAFLTYELIFQEQLSPDIEVVLGKPQRFEDYFGIPISAKNKGTETAQRVRIEISTGPLESDEKANIQFDYVPGKSTVKGWVGFSTNPDDKKLTTRILGFVTP